MNVGGNVAAVDKEGCSLLHTATKVGNAEIVRLLLEHGADARALATQWGENEQPMHFAAEAGNAEVAKLLLQHGARADARDAYGNTPLLCAAECGSVEVVKLLLGKGVDV